MTQDEIDEENRAYCDDCGIEISNWQCICDDCQEARDCDTQNV